MLNRTRLDNFKAWHEAECQLKANGIVAAAQLAWLNGPRHQLAAGHSAITSDSFPWPEASRSGTIRRLCRPNGRVVESQVNETGGDEIVRCVNAFWDENRRPMLLSSVGTTVGQRVAQEARTRAGSLRAYIRTYLNDRLAVIVHSKNATIVAAVPQSQVSVSQDWDALLAAGTRESRSAARRFNGAFWAAFRKPLDESSARYLTVESPIRFTDLPPGQGPTGAVEIARTYILGDDASDANVAERVRQWLQDHNLEESRFIHVPEERGAKRQRTLPADDLLGRLVLALDPEELDQITMSVALVAKLRREAI